MIYITTKNVSCHRLQDGEEDQHDAEGRDRVTRRRMFAPPRRDHGAAKLTGQSEVRSGTDNQRRPRLPERAWYQGSGSDRREGGCESIVVYPTTRVQSQGAPFRASEDRYYRHGPGQLMADLIDPVILAIERALMRAVYDRPPVEIVPVASARPAPGRTTEGPPGLRRFFRRGICVVVIASPFIPTTRVNLARPSNPNGWSPAGPGPADAVIREEYASGPNGDIPPEGGMEAQLLLPAWLRQGRFFGSRVPPEDLSAD